MTTDSPPSSTFQSIFFDENGPKTVRVPDYQRAFAWEGTQIDLFIGDLEKYKSRPGDYYFGHYIVENAEDGWDLVDGQQRITTFVLFLMICRLLSQKANPAFSLIDRFLTVSYDKENLKGISERLAAIKELSGNIDLKLDIPDDTIINSFLVNGDKLTRSLKRVVWSLLRFHQAFDKRVLKEEDIGGYIGVVMNANCSYHIAKNKSVAVNVFEMHNTRGIRLTTIEIVKAKLMQFVYDNCGVDERENKVQEIQNNFGEIFRMEESLAAQTFRGELSLEHLLRLHLRVVDDGSKVKKQDFHSPAENADVDAIVKYLDGKLNWVDSEKKIPRSSEEGVNYALEMTMKFKKSVQIVSEFLPKWDAEESLVGDVLIFERDLSCQLFLLVCHHFKLEIGKTDERIDKEVITLWERLLFTRDFHEEYYNLKGGRDDFQGLFAECFQDNANVKDVISKYLKNGFRSDKTKNLQKIVRDHLASERNKNEILTKAYHWWKHKMIYVIYKYETSKGADIRKVVKGKISCEHIFPQTWDWMKKDLQDKDDTLKDEAVWLEFQESIDACKHGIGNILLVTPNENTSEGNLHPKYKHYDQLCKGGSYEEHNMNRDLWEDRNKWRAIIERRGLEIYNFMFDNLIGSSDTELESAMEITLMSHPGQLPS